MLVSNLLKHYRYLLNLIVFLNTKLLKHKIIFIFKSEFLPLLNFLKKNNFIYKFKIDSSFNYFILYFKFTFNSIFFKKIKIYNLDIHSFVKIRNLFLIHHFNFFKFYIILTSKGFYSLFKCLKFNLGGILITSFF